MKELERMADLKTYQILDTLSEEEYDEITRIVAQICETPVSLISLLDEKRQWFKSHFGLHITETPKQYSFCVHAIHHTDDVFIIPDARQDPRFRNNPLVTGEPYIIFYAGVPLISPQGFPLGTLCAIDHQPRKLDKKQVSALQTLAKQVVKLFELRKSNVKLHQSEERYRVLMENSVDMVFLLDEKGRIIEGNQAACSRLNYSSKEITQLYIADIDIIEAKDTLIKHRKKRDKMLRFETVFKHKDGIQIPVECDYIHFIQADEKYIYCIARDITERKYAEKVIKESEEQYKFLAENTSDVVLLINAQDNFVYLSQNIEELTGYKEAELKKPDFYKNILLDHSSIVQSIVSEIKSGKERITVEYAIKKKSGEVIWVQSRIKVILNEQWERSHLLISSNDITERKNAEQALKISEEKFRLLFENMNAAFALHKIVTNEKGLAVDYTFIEVNPYFEKLLGLKRETVINKNVMEVLPDTELYWIEIYGKVALTGEPLEYTNYAKGFDRYFETKVYSPQHEYFAVTFTDITEKIKAQKALKESKERYKNFIDSVTEGVYRFDLKEPMDIKMSVEAQIQYLYANAFLAECNQELLKMYACAEEYEILGKSLAEIHGGDKIPENIKAVRAFIMSGYKTVQEETFEPDKQGVFHHYANNTIGMLNDQGCLTHFWGTQADISKIKAYEKELILAKEKAEEKERLLQEKHEEIGRQNEVYQATNRELAESNRKSMNINKELQKANEELDNFVYRVSHDLRSPIASCLALVDLCLQEKNPRQLEEYLRMQEKSLQKQDKFIYDILNYSRNTRHEVEPEVINIKMMIEEMVNLSSHDYRNTNCSLEIKGNTKIVCDEMRLQIILNNLISNAFKYSMYAEHPVVIIRLEVTPTELKIEIKDNGIGIPNESQSKIFSMFYRATTRSSGSGLGLYIVKEALDKLKGCIKVASEVGQGTTFTVSLPNHSHRCVTKKV
ncbi:PAS domain S-box protein [Catalinimonas niigatensis]|uniref:PAS domain S-box protein n=1 Tax=Catalinimonas niigatensis TaxID=1397264 RepID=UPI00266569C1|nr:PAS domain S-box protein [Catalinimonas niigatensis]WPP51708.1 PAS domain S-box protein [Catalinimonas niigatensis]